MEKIDSKLGLSVEQARYRLRAHGYNELGIKEDKGIVRIVIDVLHEPMLLLLLSTGAIYLFLGEIADAILLMTFILVVIGITVAQERKTERALQTLQAMASPRATVIRGGVHHRIPGREVVLGDILILNEGDRIAADGALVEESNFSVDESLLTGESLPVTKELWTTENIIARPGGDGGKFVYSGCLVASGSAVVQVVRTGMDTEMAQIGKSLSEVKEQKSPLNYDVQDIVRVFIWVGVIVSILIVLVYGLRDSDWMTGVLAGLTLAMSILPEEFPVIITIFMAFGAWRMAQKKILTRKLTAIETLGRTNILCSDKTGTITLNNLAVSEADIFSSDRKDFIIHALLACRPNHPEAIEKSAREWCKKVEGEEGYSFEEDKLKFIDEYPLTSDRLVRVMVWRTTGRKHIITAMGAPEAVAELCHIGKKEEHELRLKVQQMSERGLRMVAIAKSDHDAELPKDAHDMHFTYLGLLAFSDQIRPNIAAAIEQCHEAGIRVIMITGDYPGTALNIANSIGLPADGNYLSGDDVKSLQMNQLRKKMANISVCARIMPEQKLRIVQALCSDGDVIAMTGDGVNDAPALKASDIGIAMGERGTDVAREAADLVLVDDDFNTIVEAIRSGRKIYDNLKKAIVYTVAVHIPIAGLSFLPLLFGWPMLLMPAHIAFLELVIDPSCSVAFESAPEHADVMKRPPRKRGEKILDRSSVIAGLIQGFAVLVVCMLLFSFLHKIGRSHEQIRALVFVCLIISNLLMVLSNRSASKKVFDGLKGLNSVVRGIIGSTIIVLMATIYVPFLSQLFKFTPPDFRDYGYVLISLFLASIFLLFSKRIRLHDQVS